MNIELNVWLAVHLFKRENVRPATARYDTEHERVYYDADKLGKCLVSDMSRDTDWADHVRTVPDYSGTWEGMGLVIEAMREKPLKQRAAFRRVLQTIRGPEGLEILNPLDITPEAVALVCKAALESNDAK